MNVQKILEACGIEMVTIPSGRYTVGCKAMPPLLQPAGVDFLPPQATPAQVVETADFLISAEPLRLEQWHQLTTHPALTGLKNLITADLLAKTTSRITLSDTLEFPPVPSTHSSYITPARQIRQDVEPNPPLVVDLKTAVAIATALHADLPRWYEWEIATRGPEGWLYPWGNETTRAELTFEYQSYSVDTESDMGYYNADQVVAFVRSFGRYAQTVSPFGLRKLAFAGREWNLCHAGLPFAQETAVLRSLADVGNMAMMIPGIRPMTWAGHDWCHTQQHLAFSGPSLVHATPETAVQSVYPEASLRLVIRGQATK